MKKFVTLFCFLLLITGIFAQSPSGFTYQAVIRDDGGNPVTQEYVSIEIRLLQGSADGTAVFSEWHETETNSLGLINLKIGSIESLEGINWGNGPYFIEISVDGELMGVSQLLSVPYAMHADTSGDTFSGQYDDLEGAPDLGDFIIIEAPEQGDLLFYNEGSWESLPIGETGTVLQAVDGVPQWVDPDAVSDYDGNMYSTVTIGNQQWFAQNLRVTHYNNGDPIATGLDNTDWSETDEGAYAVYNDNPANADIYGKLYNFFAVEDDRGLCPFGWRAATDQDWKDLEMFLGMSESEANSNGWRGQNEGGMLKATGTEYWNSPNEGATNESGFTAMPGGSRGSSGHYFAINSMGRHWTSTSFDAEDSIWRSLSSTNAQIYRSEASKNMGYAVRCIKEQ